MEPETPQIVEDNFTVSSLFDLSSVMSVNDGESKGKSVHRRVISYDKTILGGNSIGLSKEKFVVLEEITSKNENLMLNLFKECSLQGRLAGSSPAMPSLRLEMADLDYYEPIRDREKDWILQSHRKIINQKGADVFSRQKLGKYDPLRPLDNPLYWSEEFRAMIRENRIVKRSATISETACIVTIYGLGVNGRVFSEGASGGRALVVEVYSRWNHHSYGLVINMFFLRHLFANQPEYLLPGKKIQLMEKIISMLYFEYTVIIPVKRRRHRKIEDEQASVGATSLTSQISLTSHRKAQSNKDIAVNVVSADRASQPCDALKPTTAGRKFRDRIEIQTVEHLEPPDMPIGYPKTVAEMIRQPPVLPKDPRNPPPFVTQELKIGTISRETGAVLRGHVSELRRKRKEEVALMEWARQKGVPKHKKHMLVVRCRRVTKIFMVLMAFQHPQQSTSVTIKGHVPGECGAAMMYVGLSRIRSILQVDLDPEEWTREDLKKLLYRLLGLFELEQTGIGKFAFILKGSKGCELNIRPPPAAKIELIERQRRRCPMNYIRINDPFVLHDPFLSRPSETAFLTDFRGDKSLVSKPNKLSPVQGLVASWIAQMDRESVETENVNSFDLATLDENVVNVEDVENENVGSVVDSIEQKIEDETKETILPTQGSISSGEAKVENDSETSEGSDAPEGNQSDQSEEEKSIDDQTENRSNIGSDDDVDDEDDLLFDQIMEEQKAIEDHPIDLLTLNKAKPEPSKAQGLTKLISPEDIPVEKYPLGDLSSLVEEMKHSSWSLSFGGVGLGFRRGMRRGYLRANVPSTGNRKYFPTKAGGEEPLVTPLPNSSQDTKVIANGNSKLDVVFKFISDKQKIDDFKETQVGSSVSNLPSEEPVELVPPIPIVSADRSARYLERGIRLTGRVGRVGESRCFYTLYVTVTGPKGRKKHFAGIKKKIQPWPTEETTTSTTEEEDLLKEKGTDFENFAAEDENDDDDDDVSISTKEDFKEEVEKPVPVEPPLDLPDRKNLVYAELTEDLVLELDIYFPHSLEPLPGYVLEAGSTFRAEFQVADLDKFVPEGLTTESLATAFRGITYHFYGSASGEEVSEVERIWDVLGRSIMEKCRWDVRTPLSDEYLLSFCEEVKEEEDSEIYEGLEDSVKEEMIREREAVRRSHQLKIQLKKLQERLSEEEKLSFVNQLLHLDAVKVGRKGVLGSNKSVDTGKKLCLTWSNVIFSRAVKVKRKIAEIESDQNKKEEKKVATNQNSKKDFILMNVQFWQRGEICGIVCYRRDNKKVYFTQNVDTTFQKLQLTNIRFVSPFEKAAGLYLYLSAQLVFTGTHDLSSGFVSFQDEDESVIAINDVMEDDDVYEELAGNALASAVEKAQKRAHRKR